MLTKAAELESSQVGGEHTRCVVADLHCVASSPEEQPLQLAVAEQSVCAEVPGQKNSVTPDPCTRERFCPPTPGEYSTLDQISSQLNQNDPITKEMKLLHVFIHTCVLYYANVALGGSGRARPQRQQDFKPFDS